MADADTVRVLRPDGRYSSIPLSMMALARAKGYQMAPAMVAPAKTPMMKEDEPVRAPAGNFLGRVMGRISGNVTGALETPKRIMAYDRQRFQEAKAKGDTIGMLRALGGEGAFKEGLTPMVEGLASISAPGLASRTASGEDPAAIAGDAAMMMTPGGEEAGKFTHTAVDTAKAGPLWGAQTRAAGAFEFLNKSFGDVPIEHEKALSVAEKAKDLAQRGYTLPKPMADFIAWIEQKSKPGLDRMRGGMLDRAGSSMPLTYAAARDFIVSLGNAIPWEPHEVGGAMWRLARQMRQSLTDAVTASLKPYNADALYRRANADFEKAAKARESWGPKGYVLGKVAGYGAGASGAGHPLILGYAGGKAGAGLAESLARKVTERGRERVVPTTLDIDLQAQSMAKKALGPDWAKDTRAYLQKAQEIKTQLLKEQRGGR